MLLRETEHAPWPSMVGGGGLIAAHEFHFAALEDIPADARFAYRVVRGRGIVHGHDGIVTANILASFSHQRGVGADPWPARFAVFMRRCASALRRTVRERLLWKWAVRLRRGDRCAPQARGNEQEAPMRDPVARCGQIQGFEPPMERQ